MSELTWKTHGRQDPEKILGVPKGAAFGGDRIYREAKAGPYRIRQFQTVRISKEEDPYRGEDYWVYGPGRNTLLCIVQPHRLDDFLELLSDA